MKITVRTKKSAINDDRKGLPQWHIRHIERTYGKSEDAREHAATLVAKKVTRLLQTLLTVSLTLDLQLFLKLVSARNGPNFLAVGDFFTYFVSEV
jgi:hypothetical protein